MQTATVHCRRKRDSCSKISPGPAKAAGEELKGLMPVVGPPSLRPCSPPGPSCHAAYWHYGSPSSGFRINSTGQTLEARAGLMPPLAQQQGLEMGSVIRLGIRIWEWILQVNPCCLQTLEGVALMHVVPETEKVYLSFRINGSKAQMLTAWRNIGVVENWGCFHLPPPPT